MEILAIVPARKGSKGLKGKNIRFFKGKPLLAHAIECALRSGVINKVILSTDSDEYLRIGRQYGAEADHLRPGNLATDTTPMIDVISYELGRLKQEENYQPDIIVLLQPTQPLRKEEQIKEALRICCSEKNCDSVISVVEVPKHFSPGIVMKIEDNRLRLYEHADQEFTRRQDVPKVYSRDGTLYLFKYSSFMKYGSIYGEICRPLIINQQHSVNIDDIQDWEELLLTNNEAVSKKLYKQERQKRIDKLNYDPDNVAKFRVGRSSLSGSENLVHICWKDRYNYPINTVMCLESGHVFLDPCLTQVAYADFYNGIYRTLVSAYHGREINNFTVQEEQQEYGRYLYKVLERFGILEEIRSILDVGGSTGVVSRVLVDKMFGSSYEEPTVTLLDPAADELDVAPNRFERIQGVAEDLENFGRKWDLILLCQTIDHIVDIPKTLNGIHAVMGDNGYLFVDIVDWYFVIQKNRSISESIKIDHPQYLTVQTMRVFLKAYGFRIIGEAVEPDGMHVGFICRATDKRVPVGDSLRDYAVWLYNEVRKIQALEQQ
jgi:CMP-N-acetylneuraminic acid synthetase/ubiquinone/menaquinone biosynthesis C-methylase UbiE